MHPKNISHPVIVSRARFRMWIHNFSSGEEAYSSISSTNVSPFLLYILVRGVQHDWIQSPVYPPLMFVRESKIEIELLFKLCDLFLYLWYKKMLSSTYSILPEPNYYSNLVRNSIFHCNENRKLQIHVRNV